MVTDEFFVKLIVYEGNQRPDVSIIHATVLRSCDRYNSTTRWIVFLAKLQLLQDFWRISKFRTGKKKQQNICRVSHALKLFRVSIQKKGSAFFILFLNALLQHTTVSIRSASPLDTHTEKWKDVLGKKKSKS